MKCNQKKNERERLNAAAMNTAFIILFLLFISSPASPAPTPLLNDQILGLIVFKSGLHDPTAALSSWSPDDSSPCSWSHITCSSSSSSVFSLSLSSLSLSSSSFPPGLDFLHSLRSLSLSSNSFSGAFPSSLPCSSLRFLSLSSNLFYGNIDPSLSRCFFLLHLNLSSNHLSGDFSFIFSSLTRLRVLDLSFNSLSGPLPDSIASLHNLKVLNLSGNRFSGRLPLSLAVLPHLLSLDLASNQFSGEFPKWISFLTALRRVDLSDNRLDGTIPADLSALQNLSFLDLSFNALNGDIPASLANCANLTELHLGGNALSGNIPPAVFGMGLKVLDLAGNELDGRIPSGSGKRANSLQFLNLSGNRLVGELPPDMATFANLQYLNLSWNYQLHSKLPQEIGAFKNLSVLDLRNSGFYGTIPRDICNSGSLTILQLDGNSLSGQIPVWIGNCSSLHLLSLSHNKLTGSIPAAMAELKKLEILNLEFNSLSGEIPPQLGSLSNLVAVNISNNRLVGRLPAAGVFPSLDQSALRGNLGLCSPLVSEPCEMDEIPKPLVLDPNTINKGNGSKRGHPADGEAESRHRRILSLSVIIAIAAAFIIIVGVLVVTLLNISARKRLENALESICSTSSRSGKAATVGKMVNFGPKSSDLSNLTTDSLLTKATEIGRGAFGVVYRAAGPVAIRKFLPNCALQNQDDFDREIRALAKARHPNLLAIKGYYFTPQIQLLITEFASGGSVHSRLHCGGGLPLSWPERFNIALGTARGLAHLHRAFRPPVIHYNVKPSNVLLDAGGEAKVADFGLSRLLRPRPDRQAAGRSALGYAAPELACGSSRVSEKCDVYGFGVILLELVTGRKAVEIREDEMVILVDEVTAVLERGEAEECVDRKIEGFVEEEAVPMLKLGLVCASQIPSSRPTMAEVVQIMEVIKAPVIERMAAFS